MNTIPSTMISLQNYLSIQIVSLLVYQKTPKGQKLAISIIYYTNSFFPYLLFDRRRGEYS